MKKKKFIQRQPAFVLRAAALGMYLCLLLLTGMNFIIYAEGNQSVLAKEATCPGAGDENIPEKPVEEKTSSGMNISEELMHEYSHLPSCFLTPRIASYSTLHTEALSIGHYDLVSPPPDQD